jgi:hypothetical protein
MRHCAWATEYEYEIWHMDRIKMDLGEIGLGGV